MLISSPHRTLDLGGGASQVLDSITVLTQLNRNDNASVRCQYTQHGLQG